MDQDWTYFAAVARLFDTRMVVSKQTEVPRLCRLRNIPHKLAKLFVCLESLAFSALCILMSTISILHTF